MPPIHNKEKAIKICEMIAQDMANDARKFEGFDGKTVAEYFGNQGAAIATLAHIIKAQVLK